MIPPPQILLLPPALSQSLWFSFSVGQPCSILFKILFLSGDSMSFLA